jgi:hypothetical protein
VAAAVVAVRYVSYLFHITALPIRPGISIFRGRDAVFKLFARFIGIV